MSQQKEKSDQKLGIGLIAAYASPGMPIAALGLPLIVHLPPFYSGTVGLSIGLVGLVFMLTRFWDVFTDPLMGWAADRFQTRWGRRRPWIIASVPIVMLASYMIFLPPAGVGWLYLLGWMLFLYIGWTMLTISHLSWGSELSGNYHQRSLVQGAREGFVIVGMILALSLPALIQYVGEGTAEEVQRDAIGSMGWFIILLLPLTVLIAAAKVPEQKFVHKYVSLRETLQVFRTNRPLRHLLGADFSLALSLGIVSSMFLFLIVDTLKLDRGIANLLLISYFIVGISSVPIFVKIAKHFGKHRAQVISSAFTIVTLPTIFILPEGNVLAALAVWALLGLNMGAGAILLRSMTADVCDEDCIQTGSERMGLFYAMLTMTTKIGLAMSIGLIYPLIGWTGFVHGGENNSEILFQIKVIYVVFPAMMNLIAMILMWGYPLDQKRQEANRQILEARHIDKAEKTDEMAKLMP